MKLKSLQVRPPEHTQQETREQHPDSYYINSNSPGLCHFKFIRKSQRASERKNDFCEKSPRFTPTPMPQLIMWILLVTAVLTRHTCRETKPFNTPRRFSFFIPKNQILSKGFMEKPWMQNPGCTQQECNPTQQHPISIMEQYSESHVIHYCHIHSELTVFINRCWGWRCA